VNEKLKHLVLFLLDKLGINSIFRFINRNKAIILWYHGVSEDNFKLLDNYDERHVPKSLFDKQLSYLLNKGYRFVSLKKLIDIIKDNKQKAQKIVTITFDDGFMNVIQNAYPIMVKKKAKGCFFLTSNFIDNNKLLWTDHVETVIRNYCKNQFKFIFKDKEIIYPLNEKDNIQYAMKDIKSKLKSLPEPERLEHMQQFNIKNNSVPKEFLPANWDQIKKLDKSILEIGSHTKSHPSLENVVSEQKLKEEIEESKIKIEDKIGYRVNHFCYPSGSFNDRVIRFIKKFGYISAATVIQGFNAHNTNQFALKRIGVNKNYLLFKAAISGSYFSLKKLMNYFN